MKIYKEKGLVFDGQGDLTLSKRYGNEKDNTSDTCIDCSSLGEGDVELIKNFHYHCISTSIGSKLSATAAAIKFIWTK